MNEAKHINFIIFPDMNLLDFSGPLEVFATANRLSKDAGNDEPYIINFFSNSKQPIATTSGFKVVTEPLPESNVAIDTLIIPGGIGVGSAVKDSRLLSWIIAHSANARRIVSICSGAFILAACGLLDKRRAVTHWSISNELAKRYPQIKVESDPIFIQDGPIWTSAGVTAGIDLALSLVQHDLDHKTALSIAKDLVVFIKRPGEHNQLSDMIKLQSESGTFDKLHSWICANLDKNLTITVLAAHTNMSERNFARIYKEKVGTSPAKSIEKIRLHAVKTLLENTELPLKRIVMKCGYSGEATLRRNFSEEFGNTPLQYRNLFRQTKRL